jgi:catechol 2,3-dioxygenase-like lactoylglutathione lyase family enzyme
MTRVQGAHHTSFTVPHLEKSVEFFRDVLGLELLFIREVSAAYIGRIVGHPGCVLKAALLRIPGSNHHIELFQYLEPAPAEAGGPHEAPGLRPWDVGSSHLALLVDDLPGWYPELRTKGVRVLSEPVLIDSGPNRGAYAVYLRDPNGILIELFQPPRRPQS